MAFRRSGDIRYQCRKLCRITPNVACFRPIFRGGGGRFFVDLHYYVPDIVSYPATDHNGIWQSFTAIGRLVDLPQQPTIRTDERQTDRRNTAA